MKIDCNKIENEENIYYYLCKNDTESSIISDTINIWETISVSTDISNIEETIISDSAINTQTILPETTNIEETIISDTTAIKQTILSDIILDTTNIHKTIPGTTNIKTTILLDTTNIHKTIPGTTNIKTTILSDTTNIHKTIPGTTNIKTTILSDTTNIHKTIPGTTNIKTTILPNATYTEPILLPQTTILSNTNNSIDTTNFASNKYTILFYGYDNYNFLNNIITFSIYFFENKAVAFPKFIFFTINIIFEYTLRNLDEKLNQNLTCSLEKEGKLVNYNCRSNPQEKMNIMKITANNDFNFNFNIPYDFIISPFAQFNKDIIINQTGNSIASRRSLFFMEI